MFPKEATKIQRQILTFLIIYIMIFDFAGCLLKFSNVDESKGKCYINVISYDFIGTGNNKNNYEVYKKGIRIKYETNLPKNTLVNLHIMNLDKAVSTVKEYYYEYRKTIRITNKTLNLQLSSKAIPGFVTFYVVADQQTSDVVNKFNIKSNKTKKPGETYLFYTSFLVNSSIMDDLRENKDRLPKIFFKKQ